MAYEKVKRNRYFDPPSEYPHSSRNHAEDQQEFHLPMERMHNSNLHDWGIAHGLEVSGTIGGTEVVINPGVAIDGDGQLISLSAAGHGDIGPNPLGGQHNEVVVPVHLGTGSHAGKTVYITIQFSEIMRPSEGSGGRMEQVPWLRLQPVSGDGAYVDNGTSIILAIAGINAAGNLTSLKAEDSTLSYRRRLIGETIEELRIQRSEKIGDTVDEVTSCKIKPGDGGGLQITVPHSGDGISLNKEGGGNFSELEIRANTIVAKDSAGREALKLDAGAACLSIGTNGNEGDLKVKDGLGREVLKFDSNSAALYIGANGNEGDIIVRDSKGADSAKIDGNTGTIMMRKIDPYGNALDIDARYVRIHGWDLMLDGRSGGNKRALVDLGNKLIINYNGDYANGVDVASTLRIKVGDIYRTLGGNPARYVKLVRMYAYGNHPRTVTEDADLGSSRQFVAFAAIVGMDPLGDFDRHDGLTAEVYKVDGNSTYKWFNGGDHLGPAGSDANFHTPVYKGTGRIITFRTRTFNNAGVWAIGVVFYE